MRRNLPAWVLPLVIVCGLLLIGLGAWRSLTASPVPVGQDIAVHPGMYDMRAEMRRSR